jgi:hypothetical protein
MNLVQHSHCIHWCIELAFKYLALAPILLLNLPSATPHASISILHSHPVEKMVLK